MSLLSQLSSGLLGPTYSSVKYRREILQYMPSERFYDENGTYQYTDYYFNGKTVVREYKEVNRETYEHNGVSYPDTPTYWYYQYQYFDAQGNVVKEDNSTQKYYHYQLIGGNLVSFELDQT